MELYGRPNSEKLISQSLTHTHTHTHTPPEDLCGGRYCCVLVPMCDCRWLPEFVFAMFCQKGCIACGFIYFANCMLFVRQYRMVWCILGPHDFH